MSSIENLREALLGLRRQAVDSALVNDFLALAARGPVAFTRQSLDAHFTASCWLVSADDERVLLTHHRKLGRWLQLGGHADGDTDLARAALREAREESGLPELAVEGGIFDLDKHRIPARGEEPAHWHYDVRYVIRCGPDERYRVNAESLDLAWRPVAALADDASLDASIRRMARRWLEMSANG